ncbi:hypothetical protein BY996DRAFT_3693103 [Phakopsora pachyrhizi]|nr:hypothetical protein BY996DRAFT_3693103 [Phakopsora pachyrhizi]
MNRSLERCKVYEDRIKQLKDSLDSNSLSIRTGQSHLTYLNHQSEQVLRSIESESKRLIDQISASSKVYSRKPNKNYEQCFNSSRKGPPNSEFDEELDKEDVSLIDKDHQNIGRAFKNESINGRDDEDNDSLNKFQQSYIDSNHQLNRARLKLQDLSDSIEKAIGRQRLSETQLTKNILRKLLGPTVITMIEAFFKEVRPSGD